MKTKNVSKKPSERSFTIIETLVALSILLPVVLESVSTQGAIINGGIYTRKVTEATWLAKQVMSQVEYNWRHYDIKTIDGTVRDQKFENKDRDPEFDYTYTLAIEEWKLPLFDLLLNGGPQQEDDSDSEQTQSPLGGAGGGAIESAIKGIFDGHVLKIATVEVFWPEGARQDSVRLSLLLPNQRALDQYIVSKKQVMDGLLKQVANDVSGIPK